MNSEAAASTTGDLRAGLRVGIAGCGLIAGGPVRQGRPIRGNHAQACRDVPGVSLVAACDPDRERRQSFGAIWGVPDVYATAAEMLAVARIDLLIVATTAETHEEVCLAGIEAGIRGLLCEKPFTGKASAAERVASAAAARQVPLVVNFSRRWDASHQQLAKRIREGAIGKARHATGCYTGTLRGNGAHLVDVLRMMWPLEWGVEWAAGADAGTGDGQIGAELASATGVRATLFPIRDPEYFVFELELFGSRGRARLVAQGNDIRLDLPAEDPDYPGYRYLKQAEVLPRDTLPDSFAGALAELVAAVETGRPLSTAPIEILGSLALLESIVARSEQKGRS